MVKYFPTFAYMKQEVETITIRPGKKYAGFKKRLEAAAKKKEWSINKYALIQLDKALNKTKK